MTAQRLMNAHPVVLRDTDTIGTAADTFMTHRSRSLPVVDRNGRYLGVLGVSCMLRLVLPKAAVARPGPSGLAQLTDGLDELRDRLSEVIDEPVTICLDPDVPVVHPDTPLIETLLTLYSTKTTVGVVDETTRRLLGVISYFDVGERIMALESGPAAEVDPATVQRLTAPSERKPTPERP